MKFFATCTLYIEIEAESESKAYDEARKVFKNSYWADSIEIEPYDEED